MASKNLEISLLLDCYSGVLTKKQREVLYDYYDNDLSLSEIAENEGITRQGARDTITRAVDKLLFLEEKVGLLEMQKIWYKKTQKIKDFCEKIEENREKSAMFVRKIKQILEE